MSAMADSSGGELSEAKHLWINSVVSAHTIDPRFFASLRMTVWDDLWSRAKATALLRQFANVSVACLQ